jgi:PAS domain S-box-containing protein
MASEAAVSVGYVAIFRNVALLLVLVVFARTLRDRAWPRTPLGRRIVTGLLYGSIAIAGMQSPFELQPGVRIDPRSPLIAVAGLLGSWPAALVAALMSLALRVSIGGPGVVAGLASGALAVLIGVGAHPSFQQAPERWGITRFAAFGTVIAVIGVLVGLLLPRPMVLAFLATYAAPTFAIFVLSTVAVGLVERNELVRVRQARQLASTNELLAAAERLGHVGSWQLLPDTGEIHWSPEMCRIFGYDAQPDLTADEILERTTHPDDRPMLRERFATLLSQRPDGEPFEYRIVRRDGSVLYVWSRAEMRDDGPGGTPRVVGFIQDVTSQREARTQLVRATRMASLGQLAAGVGHEINNPLTIMQSQTDQLLRRLRETGEPDERVRLNVDRINDCIRRIGRITQALRSYSRPPQQRSEELDLGAVAQTTTSLLGDLTPSARLQVVTRLPAAPVTVCGDPDQLQQVLLNLLLNALHATEGVAEPRVELRIEAHGREAVVVVSDNGVGIAPDRRGHIFDAFFTTKEPGRGTGLGLSVSQNYVRDMGGRIEVESELGKGASFRVVLPAVEAAGR